MKASELRCMFCGASPALDPKVILHRQNPKGEPGQWACDKCNTQQVDEDVAEVVGVVAGRYILTKGKPSQ